MSAKKEEPAEGAEQKPKGKKKKLIIIVVALLLVLGGGGGAAFFMMGSGEEEEVVEEEPVVVKQIESADLGSFVVNLSDTSSFLKIKIMMEYDAALIEKQTAETEGGAEGGGGHGGGASGGAKEEPAMSPYLLKRDSQIKDTIIRILSSKKANELLTPEGKDRLKEELVEGINEAIGLEEPAVTAVYFTEFMIQ